MPITTVAAIIKNDEDKILLTRRNVAPFKGQWCLPGGHIDENEKAFDDGIETAAAFLWKSLLVQFDTAVNMGIRRAVRFLQKAVGCTVDGAFGPRTKEGADACDPDTTIPVYCDAREDYYRRLAERNPRLGKFLRGWLNRLGALRGEVGLQGLEAVSVVDFGGEAYIFRIPDLGVDPEFDLD